MATAQPSSCLESNEGKRFSNKLSILVNDIAIAMEKLNYPSYRGNVSKKETRAKYTYSYKCEAKPFLNSLATNEYFKSRLIRQIRNVTNLLADPYCELFRPLTIDYNLIEVDNSTCWSVKNRSFMEDSMIPVSLNYGNHCFRIIVIHSRGSFAPALFFRESATLPS